MFVSSTNRYRALILILCLTSAIITVGSQYYYILDNLGREYIRCEDFARHKGKIDGTQGAPYRYRLLADYALEAYLIVIGASSQDRYEAGSFTFRLLQNLLIFLLFYRYLRTLKITIRGSCIGILILSYSMCFAFYQSDLSYYTYLQIIMFLFAAIMINEEKYWWILPITCIAAFTREEGLFIPIMLLTARLVNKPLNIIKVRILTHNKTVKIFFLSEVAFLLIYFGIRAAFGEASYAGSRYGEIYPGFELLRLNILNPRSWIGLIQMYNLLPLCLAFIRRWPGILKGYLYCLVLPWFVAEFSFGSTDETRLFLVPLIIVFIPALIYIIEGCYAKNESE